MTMIDVAKTALFAILATIALHPQAQAQSCVMLGTPRSVDCIDETGGRHCRCLVIENTCTFEITVRYNVLGGGGLKSMPLGPGKTNSDTACTTMAHQSVNYVGWEKR